MKKKILVSLLISVLASAASADMVDIVVSSVGPLQEGTTDPYSVVTDPIQPTNYIEIYSAMSRWVDLDIIYTDDGMGMGLISLGLDVIVTGPASLYVGELGPAGDNTLLTYAAGAWDLGKTPAPISFIGPELEPAKRYVIDLAMSNGLMGEPGVPVTALDHLLLHIDGGSDTVNVYVVNDMVNTTGGGTYNMMMGTPDFGPGVIILDVPEPMTVMLLGLGAVLLRKRF